MKKLMALLLASIMIGTIPAVFASTPVTTGVYIPPGSGDPPIMKAKWELPDEDPLQPGTQILPPMVWQANKTVTYWAIATDPNGYDNLRDVHVKVYHPDGSFKYQIQLLEEGDCNYNTQSVISALTNAYNKNLVTFGNKTPSGVKYTLQEVIEELDQCSAKAYKGTSKLYYEQMCGEDNYPYTVSAFAYDKQNSKSYDLNNTFEYICTAGIELDFNSINFENVVVSSDKWVEGDKIWDGEPAQACLPKPNSDCRPPTIRNTGNTPVKIQVMSTDMGFGQGTPTCSPDAPGPWCVQFDARLGLNAISDYDPNVWTTLDGTLGLSEEQKISFSIHVFKADPDTTHSGTTYIQPIAVNYPWWPIE